jgi:hypothetical protein
MTFELLTGTRPYVDEDPASLMEAHLTRDLPDPRDRLPDLPAGLCDFMFKTTRKDQNERYRDTGEAQHVLETISWDLGLAGPEDRTEDRQMLSLFLFYREAQRLGLNALLEEFSGKLREKGIALKAADFKDIA